MGERKRDRSSSAPPKNHDEWSRGIIEVKIGQRFSGAAKLAEQVHCMYATLGAVVCCGVFGAPWFAATIAVVFGTGCLLLITNERRNREDSHPSRGNPACEGSFGRPPPED